MQQPRCLKINVAVSTTGSDEVWVTPAACHLSYYSGSVGCALRAFGYCRVSTDQRRGSGISLDEQQRKIEGRCVENGWTLQRLFNAGISGSTQLGWRPEGARLLAAVKASDVVVAKLDRTCGSVMKIRDEMRSRGDSVSHNLVANTLQRRAEP